MFVITIRKDIVTKLELSIGDMVEIDLKKV